MTFDDTPVTFERLVLDTSMTFDDTPVTFERLVLDTSEADLGSFWCGDGAAVELCELVASAEGTIEDSGAHHLHVDFANRVIGGGVLRAGCVQEEIRFLISPELIVSRLLTESLLGHEALLMGGFERFSNYTGYARTFEYAGPAEDSSPAHRPPLVAVDATQYDRRQVMRQFAPEAIERELNKALVGFSPPPPRPRRLHGSGTNTADAGELTEPTGACADAASPQPVCTGNWGCGAFGGDLELKAMIQWLAASVAGRPRVAYLTFGDERLSSALASLSGRLRSLGCLASDLAQLLSRFHPHKWPVADRGAGRYADLFGYLHAACDRRQAIGSAGPAADGSMAAPGGGVVGEGSHGEAAPAVTHESVASEALASTAHATQRAEHAAGAAMAVPATAGHAGAEGTADAAVPDDGECTEEDDP